MQQAAQRRDIYAAIHKGMRAMMAQALMSSGSTDWQDAVDAAQALAEVRGLCNFCAAHLAHENDFIHPAMEARAPGSAARIAEEHVEHLHAIEALRRQADFVELSSGAARTRAGETLYRQLALFVAENYQHMQIEESEHNAALWAAYSDAEIDTLHHALVSSLSPQEAQESMRWMLPYTSHGERLAMLSGIRAQAPAPVFEGLLNMLRPLLMPRDWAKLETALELPLLHQAA